MRAEVSLPHFRTRSVWYILRPKLVREFTLRN